MVIARAPKKKRKKLLIIRNLCFIFNMNKIVLIIISLSELFIFHGALSLYSHMWTIFVLFFCIQFFDCAVSLVIWWFCSNSCTFYSHWLYTIWKFHFSIRFFLSEFSRRYFNISDSFDIIQNVQSGCISSNLMQSSAPFRCK